MNRTRLMIAFALMLVMIVAPASVLAQDAPEVTCSADTMSELVWVSPRGTLEVMDDYPLWVAQELGYFEELGVDVTLEPGPLGGANVMSLLPAGQADVGYPSPGVLAASIDAEIPVTLGFGMIAGQTFNFAFPAGSDIETVQDLEGKTISLGSAAWEPIVNPILAEAGVDLDSVTYVEAGPQWGQVVDQGRADAALSWEGLRAQWDAIGLEFDYLIGTEFSDDPSNGYAIRVADLEDEDVYSTLACFFQGLAMGLEFSRLNPQAAAEITYEQFPALQEQMTPELALESMGQILVLYNMTYEQGLGYGYSDLEAWQGYLDRISELGQVEEPIAAEEAVTNEFVEFANAFDAERVAADAEAYEVSEAWQGLELNMGDM